MRLAWIAVGACSTAARPAPAPPSPSPPPPPPTSAPIAKPAPVVPDAPSDILAEPTHGCTATSVAGNLELRCPLERVIDVGDTRGEIVGGAFTLDGGSLVYRADEAAMRHNTYLFDDGVFELATRTSDGKREWYLDGTWKPGGAATLRRVIACCEDHRPALECLGQQLGAAATTCQAMRDCASLDACVQREVATRRAKACKAKDPFNCR